MGRRLLLILGILLAASCGSRAALAQDQDQTQGQEGPPAVPTPVPSFPPSGDSSAETAIPEDLKLPPAPVEAGEKIDEPASRPAAKDDNTGEPPKRTVKSTPAKPKGQAAKEKDEKGQGKGTEEESDPPRQLDAGIDDLIRGAKPKGADPLRIRTDPSVVRTQGPAAADGAPAAPARTEASGATVDRLPIGKQSVAVTVDVQAPASMNLNQVANLKLVIRNTGTSDALNVDVEDELPEGLKFISSVPDVIRPHESHLTFKIPTLAAGSERTISVKVKPTKTGPFDHAATVKFETGCRSRTRVLEPKLKVDVVANPTTGKVLKGQPVEFKVTITNLGDGRARNVAIQAKLSPGLRHDSASKSDDPILYELALPELLPGHSEKLDTLVADAVIGGEQNCTVTAKSEDVVFVPEDAQVTKTIAVVEPKLEIQVVGPDQRFTDTIADYEVVLENSGTAPARRIRVTTTLPTSGKLVGQLPPDVRYDATTRRLTWTIDQIDPQAKPLSVSLSCPDGRQGPLRSPRRRQRRRRDKERRHETHQRRRHARCGRPRKRGQASRRSGWADHIRDPLEELRHRGCDQHSGEGHALAQPRSSCGRRRVKRCRGGNISQEGRGQVLPDPQARPRQGNDSLDHRESHRHVTEARDLQGRDHPRRSDRHLRGHGRRQGNIRQRRRPGSDQQAIHIDDEPPPIVAFRSAKVRTSRPRPARQAS